MIDQIGRLQKKDPEYCQHVLLTTTLAYRPLQLLVVARLPDAISSKAENIRKITSTIFPSGTAAVHGIFQRSLGAMTRPYGGRMLLRRDIYGLGHPAHTDPQGSSAESRSASFDTVPLGVPGRSSLFFEWREPRVLKRTDGYQEGIEVWSEHLLHWLEVLSLMRKLSGVKGT